MSSEIDIGVFGGCHRCKKNWPDVSFHKLIPRIKLESLHPEDVLCDLCLAVLEIVADQTSGKDETVVQVQGGCRVCHKNWPETTFKTFAEFLGTESEPSVKPSAVQPLCDTCWYRSEADTQEVRITQAIDEAQQIATAQIERRVVVSGIKSETNVVEFGYVTHRGMEALVVSDVTVHFCAKPKVLDSPRSTYIYEAVPVPVLEAWFVAESKGQYFISFIKTSYTTRKVNS